MNERLMQAEGGEIMKNKKCFIYARCATEVQAKQGNSLQSQIRIMSEFARKHDWEVVGTFSETVSASQQDRPALKTILRRINKKEARAILCYDVTRIARNALDWFHLINKHGIEIVTPTYNSKDNKNTLVNALMFGIPKWKKSNKA